MTPTQKTARIAGALYLALVITGIFYLIYVPSQIKVAGDGKRDGKRGQI